MVREIPKAYEPQEIEERWAKTWYEEELFRAENSGTPDQPSDQQPRFSIALPPPNVTGSIHIGHMLEHTQIDMLVRWHRMRGERTLWLPGMDHAGIATQFVVERMLAKEGISRKELGREEFERRVWKWKAAFHFQTRRSNSSRPNSLRLIPSFASILSTTNCVAIPA